MLNSRSAWTTSGLVAALLSLIACSGGKPQDVPVPADWSLIAPEVRPLVEQAVERCRKNSSDAEAFAALGRLYHGNGAPALARAAYERSLALQPKEAKTLYFLGIARAEVGETGPALEALGRARDLEPGYAPLRHHLGSALLDAGRAGEAESELREAVRLDPQAIEIRVGLARALKQRGAFEEALGVLDDGLRRSPDDPAANQVAALVLKAMGRTDAASSRLAKARLYRAGIVKDPWFGEVQRLGVTVSGRLSQAEFFMENGKADDAVKILDSLAAANPRRADVQVALARALAAKGQLPRARDAYARAVEIEPRDAWTQSRLAHVLFDLGDVDGGVRHAQAAVAADPELDAALVARSRARLMKGDATGALADAAAVTASNPDDLSAQVLKGDALMALRRPDEAVLAFEAALRIKPAFDYAKDRLASARKAAGGH